MKATRALIILLFLWEKKPQMLMNPLGWKSLGVKSHLVEERELDMKGPRSEGIGANPKENPKDFYGRSVGRDGNLGGIGQRTVREEDKPKSTVSRELVGEVSSETLRSIDLPPLPQSANSLNFGDWLVIVEPMMADISYSSGTWWSLVMEGVQPAYGTWLKEDPLGRLRVQVEVDPKTNMWPRTEKRATNMLLQALPEKLRVEIVSSRRLTTHQIMFRLFCLFQPGGQSERANLLQLLTDFKLGNVVGEYAVSLRQWLRWLTRAEELSLVLPDPMVLAGVLGRVSDTLSKSGAQVGFRLASTRQQLQLDCRPEMSMNLTSGTPNPQSGKPVVKSLGMPEPPKQTSRDGPAPVNAGSVSSKAACRF